MRNIYAHPHLSCTQANSGVRIYQSISSSSSFDWRRGAPQSICPFIRSWHTQGQITTLNCHTYFCLMQPGIKPQLRQAPGFHPLCWVATVLNSPGILFEYFKEKQKHLHFHWCVIFGILPIMCVCSVIQDQRQRPALVAGQSRALLGDFQKKIDCVACGNNGNVWWDCETLWSENSHMTRSHHQKKTI